MNAMGKVEIGLLAIVALLFGIGVYFSFADHEFFRGSYVVEDGFIEWLTVVGLLASMVVCGRRFVTLVGKRSIPFVAVTGLLTLFFFFGAGEEISWGQRLFDVESSEFFKENNAQSETNLHNLVVGGKKINKMIFGTGFALILLTYLFVVTPLYRKNERARKFFANFGVPIPQNYHIAAYFVLIVVVEGLMESPKRGELTEFAGSFTVFLNLLFPYNKEIYDAEVDDSLV
ncbi:MAG: hypothetical protein JKY67_11175 [Pseudomonadales bacterium]|nr:hypothetical protein [Pseudomonadales bacterium]